MFAPKKQFTRQQCKQMMHRISQQGVLDTAQCITVYSVDSKVKQYRVRLVIHFAYQVLFYATVSWQNLKYLDKQIVILQSRVRTVIECG